MENNLLIAENTNFTINSLEVAEMLGKKHKQLMKEIRNIIEVLAGENFSLAKYFIEMEYKDSQNKSRPCYEISKMGCEILGNKLQGAKGIIFTAKYVERFNSMETLLKNHEIAFLTEQIMKLEALNTEFKTLSLEARQYFKPLHRTKLELNRLIKSLTSNNQEANLVKRWVFMKMGIRTWEDTCLDDIPKIKDLIHSTSQLVQIDNFEQISLLN